MNRRTAGFQLAVVALLVAGPAVADDPAAADVALLERHLGGADADRVIDYLKKQSQPAPVAELRKLIEQFGAEKFAARQEASRKLVAAGLPALPLLREAARNADPEIARRAAKCITDIESGPGARVPAAAVRQLVRLRHERTVEVLLSYALTADEPVQTLILDGLKAHAAGAPANGLLLQALDDPSAARRALAVQVLAGSNDREVRARVQKRLKDSDPAVRFHAAIGLLTAGDREAVPVLIALVGDAPSADIWQRCEEALYAVGGELAPGFPVGDGTADDRKRLAESWAAWWTARGAQVLLGQKDDRPNDAAVIADSNGQVFDWRPDEKPRIRVTGLALPVDARLLPGRRVLIAEERANKVTEYDARGQLLWERTFDDGPVSVQRLPNGNTFVAATYHLYEVRRDRSLVSTIDMSGIGRVSDANKLPDGRIACLMNDNRFLILTPQGRPVVNVKTEGWGGVDALPNGNVLTSLITVGKFVEYDGTGKAVWEYRQPGAHVATRLPDGTTLVASKQGRKMTKVDAAGKVLWEKDIDGYPHAMHWR